MSAEAINEIIKNRRAIFPNTYINRPIPEEHIQQILENANWAPTHRKTQPWRFKVFRKAALERLSEYLADWYKEHTPMAKFSEKKHEKTKAKPLQSDCVIAICMQRDLEERVPEWEEIAAVACAVQNMWLSCTAYGIGCYWSSPKSILEANDFLKLKEGEQCLGLLYMGYHEMPLLPGDRTPIEEKVIWLEE
ncbi:MAG: nitroreductase [Chitinophagales bacterium]|nr:nitroreductase [Chitinophagales bacterium]